MTVSINDPFFGQAVVRFGSIESSLAQVSKKADDAKQKVTELEVKVTSTRRRVKGAEGRLFTVETNVGGIKKRLGLLDKKNSDTDNWAAHIDQVIDHARKKVRTLAARLTEANGSSTLNGIKNKLGAIEVDTNELKSVVFVVTGKVNEIDALKERLAQEEAKNALLEGRVQELETQQKVSDQNNERRQKEFFEFMQKAAEMNANLLKVQEGLTQQVKEYSSQMREMNARINMASEAAGVHHKELSEGFDNLRKAQTSAIIERASMGMKSRRKSTGFCSATNLQSVNTKAK